MRDTLESFDSACANFRFQPLIDHTAPDDTNAAASPLETRAL